MRHILQKIAFTNYKFAIHLLDFSILAINLHISYYFLTRRYMHLYRGGGAFDRLMMIYHKLTGWWRWLSKNWQWGDDDYLTCNDLIRISSSHYQGRMCILVSIKKPEYTIEISNTLCIILMASLCGTVDLDQHKRWSTL